MAKQSPSTPTEVGGDSAGVKGVHSERGSLLYSSIAMCHNSIPNTEKYQGDVTLGQICHFGLIVYGGGSHMCSSPAVPTGVASAVQKLWQTACSEIGPGADFTTIVQCVENRAGVEVKGT